MKKLILAAIVAIFAALPAPAQSNAPYTEGPVWDIILVRLKHGMHDAYFKSISKTFKAVFDEAKKEGIIMDYKILYGQTSSPDDFNVMSMVQLKNYAALDTYREKIDPIARRIEGDAKKQTETFTGRVEIRDILGYKLMREVTLIDEDKKK
ncbi:hypothetical protein [Ereboglobus luteus]|uniref:NIPSNAP domain-containing protein n=1 Tax=Ereboglobus luteus TaxID=1796921 RepID=A0A2U8E5S2_9BACT|nr:hypothetical protein [Ereboglobus luteus]AWI10289.1 hypothetical protein CKA38_14435 [Ereboglobus luteus]